MTTKICSKCKVEKHVTCFNNSKKHKDGLNGICKDCWNESKRAHYQKDSSKTSKKASVKKWRKNNPGKVKKMRKNNRLKRLYKLTLDEFNNLIEQQDGQCPICELPLDDNALFGVDHCHETGRIRGILHNKCNAMLGCADDNIKMLNNGIKYLLEDYNG